MKKECGCEWGEMCSIECLREANAKIRKARRARKRGWPMLSDALACHPSQVGEMTAEAKKRGVSVEFQPDGRPKFDSARHQQQYLRAFNYYNKDSVFSPKNR